MRFRRLDLLAFGPFTERRLTFDEPAGLEVVYGPNEAGKSTTLRALAGVLFGIPERTSDAHLHPMKKLRIGAALESAGGQHLELVRRKGRKSTLADPDGRSLADDVLAPFLRGLTRERFLTTFGLDHETLRSGAEALLAGGGSVGESLFDAGLGGPGVRRMLAELEDEAASIFTPTAQQRSLNTAVRTFREARQTVTQNARSPAAWRDQEREIERLRAERTGLLAQRETLRAERSRLERELRVRPMLATLADLDRERASLGDVKALPPDARARREDALRRREGAERGRRPLADEVHRLEGRVAELEISVALAALPDVVVDEIDDELGRHRAAVADLPKRRANLASATEDVERARRATGLAEAVELDTTALARVRALANRHGELAADLRHALEAASEAEEAVERARARRAALAAEQDVSVLAGRLAALGPEDVPNARRDEREAAHHMQRQRLEARLARAGLDDDLDAFTTRAWPALEAVEALVARHCEDEVARERLAEERSAGAERARGVAEELATIRAVGAPPTEADLERARASRDFALDNLRNGVGDVTLVDLSELVRQADELADRLRLEAGRIERHARLVATEDRLAAERDELEQRERELDERSEDLARRWHALWEPCGVAPRELEAQGRWYAGVVELERHAVVWLAGERERAAAAQSRERRRAELLLALMELGRTVEQTDDLATLRERAEACLREAERRAESERAIAAELVDAEVVLEHRRARTRELDAKRNLWRNEWRDAIAPLGRDAGEDPRVVLVLADAFGELQRKLERAADLARRVDGMQRDSSVFEGKVRERIEKHAPELAGVAERNLIEAASELVRRQRNLRRDERERADVEARLTERRHELARHEGEIERARVELADLLAATGAADLDELVVLEECWQHALLLDERRGTERRRILQAGDGASITELTRAVEELDADAQRSRQHEIEVELAELDGEIDQVARQLALSEAGLEHFRESQAPENAEEAEAALSTVRAEARRYARARLAAVLLGREIERYRQENQGPILARANELFPRLTLGRYDGLQVGFDGSDRPLLRCVLGADEVGVEELSDGTRDQLYLALRVASIERHVAHDEPAPFVLDDCLVHFDDERSRAALEVLAELARSTQVLFFTHHERLVELARALPTAARIQRLNPQPGRVPS